MTACLGEPNHVVRLEHAQARLTLSYNRRGDLAIHLVSPMGTRSTLLAARCSPCPFAVSLPGRRHFISKTPASIRDPGGWGQPCALGLPHHRNPCLGPIFMPVVCVPL